MAKENKEVEKLNQLLAKADALAKEEGNFEDGLLLLEELVEKVESGELTLEQSLTAYEHGATLIKKLRGVLTGAEKKLELLTKNSRE